MLIHKSQARILAWVGVGSVSVSDPMPSSLPCLLFAVSLSLALCLHLSLPPCAILPILFLLPFGGWDMPPGGEDEACLSQGVLP